jgi:hypothetical protein
LIHDHEGESTSELGETMVEALKYVMAAWGHLFVGPFLSITLAVQYGGWGEDQQHFFRLVSNPANMTNTQRSSIIMEYLLDFRDKYQALCFTFGTVELGLFDGFWHLARLTGLFDVHAPNITKLVFKDAWDPTGSTHWLIERKPTTASCAITTV